MGQSLTEAVPRTQSPIWENQGRRIPDKFLKLRKPGRREERKKRGGERLTLHSLGLSNKSRSGK